VAPTRSLAGLRVLDFTWFGAGPVGTKWLAAAGAEVIKIETQHRVDGLRIQEPKVGDPASPNTSLFFNNFNTDKVDLLLDLNNDKGLAIARRLVAISDVVMTNFSPRNVVKWGLDYESLRAIREDVIVVHLPAMGLWGPKVHFAGFGSSFKAIGGLNMLMGTPEAAPVGPQGTFTDWCLVPSHCMTALLAAIHYRHRTGKGQQIELAQYECIINTTGTTILEYTANGRVPARIGNRHPSMAPHGHYACKGDQRWIVIAARDDAEWLALCEAVGQAGAAVDRRFATLSDRLANVDALDARVATWTRDADAYELMHRLQRAGVPAGVVQNARDLFENDEQLRAREHYVWLDHPETGRQPADRPGFRLSKTASVPARAAPCMGEQNDYVLHDLLGLSTQEIDALIMENVLY
jgi:benzylsuccinate CoA-transferase BbsF subunit